MPLGKPSEFLACFSGVLFVTIYLSSLRSEITGFRCRQDGIEQILELERKG